MKVFYKIECYDAGMKKVDTTIAADTPHELATEAITQKIDAIGEWKLYDKVCIVRPADKLILAERRTNGWAYNIIVGFYRKGVKNDDVQDD